MGIWQRPSALLALLAGAGFVHACSVDYDALAGGDDDDGGASQAGGANGSGGSILGGAAGSTGGVGVGGMGGQPSGGVAGAPSEGGSGALPGGGGGQAGSAGGGGEAVAGTAGIQAGAAGLLAGGGGGDGGAAGAPGGVAGMAGSSGAGFAGGAGTDVGGTGGALGGAGGTGGGTGGAGGTGGGIGGTAGTGGEPPWPPPSCEGGVYCDNTGTVSCCDSFQVQGGSFPMGRSDAGTDSYTGVGAGSDEQPEHDVTVSSFYLDRFEVSVGRFRNFFAAYSAGERPVAGQGAHPQILGSGWDTQWDGDLPQPSLLETRLMCDPTDFTWNSNPGANTALPINCVDWYIAFAFCIWDGGRLPTEAEWEYAAAGGSRNLLYPWGSEPPGTTHAFFNGDNFAQVGSRTLGDGWYGQSDLAGNMSEWILDFHDANWYLVSGNTCSDCANLTSAAPGPTRVIRGGDISSTAEGELRAASRADREPTTVSIATGFRCARDLDL